jgi:hypothetical protein
MRQAAQRDAMNTDSRKIHALFVSPFGHSVLAKRLLDW